MGQWLAHNEMTQSDTIAFKLDKIRKTILQVAQTHGRAPADITLIAVSKTRPPEQIREAYHAGQRDFGENYVQELTEKAALLKDLPDIRWHMIGHLQTNKVRKIVGVADVIHTIDRASVIDELAKRYARDPRASAAPLSVLIELNLAPERASEKDKTGATADELDELIDRVKAHGCLRLTGLMTVPPIAEDPNDALVYFDRLAKLARERGLRELSMGMSHDYEQAIASGATLVRVGEAIFGPR